MILIRYFNPIGTHKSGLIGKNPNGMPNNLMPYITQTAMGIHQELGVFGNDYNTHDGTDVRDYIHVVDLACSQVVALKAIKNKAGIAIYNLGTGTGYLVLDVVTAFEKVTTSRFHIQSSHIVQATSQLATAILLRQRLNLTGKSSMALKKCALIVGDSRAIILNGNNVIFSVLEL